MRACPCNTDYFFRANADSDMWLICVTGYITTSINDGPGCLLLRCPDPACIAAVGQDMILKLASKEDKEKYYRYIVRSYVEDKKKVDFICCSNYCLLK